MKPVERILSKVCNPRGLRVVEIGCGGGASTRWLQRQEIKSYIGLELEPEMISLATGRGLTNIELQDITKPWRVPPSQVDLVVGTQVLSHISESDLPLVFNEISASLNSNGELLLVERIPNTDDFHVSHHPDILTAQAAASGLTKRSIEVHLVDFFVFKFFKRKFVKK